MRDVQRARPGVMQTILLAAWISCGLLHAGETQARGDHLREIASTGWATREGGTRGGSAAVDADIHVVANAAELKAALAARAGPGGRIVQVRGSIDISEGRSYADTAEMARRGRIDIPTQTTLIGIGNDAGIRNGHLHVRADDVILRNLTIENPVDPAPQWDPDDGSKGNWNSEFDGLTIEGARHVWVDHMTFTDGSHPDDPTEVANGRHVQHHDGALDIKAGADLVTISHTVFRRHEKNTLIGSSDGAARTDAGKLRVTIHHSLFDAVSTRAPRVRFGQVHLYNNLHIGDLHDPVYRFGHAHGVGNQSRILSEANAFNITGAKDCKRIVGEHGGTTYRDAGSLLNGAPMACTWDDAIGWTPPYAYSVLPAGEVPAAVLANAGAGHL